MAHGGVEHRLAEIFANFMRTEALPGQVEQWSLTTLREKLANIGATVVNYRRRITFQLADATVPRELLAETLRLVHGLRPKPAPPRPLIRP